MNVARPWHAGVLYNRDPRFAHLLMALLQREAGLIVGDNEPDSVTDASDYTIPVHGEGRGLHHVAIEIRQDLIADENGQQAWGLLLARLLVQAYQGLMVALGRKSPPSALLSPRNPSLCSAVSIIADGAIHLP